MMDNIITILISTILSGAFATVVILWWQNRNQVKQEKIRIFTILMARRYEFTAEECVEALNMMDVVFYNFQKYVPHGEILKLQRICLIQKQKLKS